jgi:hypothetical protein
MKKYLAFFGCAVAVSLAPAVADQVATDEVDDVVIIGPPSHEYVNITDDLTLRALFYSNSRNLADPYKITRAGGHCATNGDATDLQTGLGLSTYGFGCQVVNNNAMADDFVLCDQATIEQIAFYLYQSGVTSPSINRIDYAILTADPTGQPQPAWTTVNNPPVAFTNVYKKRDIDAPADACTRRIQKVTITLSPPVTLGPGQYWLAWRAGGTGTSGPWQPPVVFPGLTGKPGSNGLQSSGGAAFAPALDGGTATPQDFVFELYGTAPGWPTSACCLLSGGCLPDTTQCECALGLDGTWQEPGTACDPDPCGQFPGACCFLDGTCQVLYPNDCAALYGAYQGPDTVCDPAPCPPPCVTCPPGANPEIEPPCYNGYVDNSNGGCNSSPPVFSPIACFQTVCGTGGNFLSGSGVQSRDTDWYEVVTTQPRIFTWTATATFPVLIFVIDGNNDCPTGGPTIIASATASACQPATITTTCLAPGTYWFWVGTQGFSGVPCNSPYVATLTCQACPPFGACCYVEGYCEEMPPTECSGIWLGEGSTCDLGPCEPCGLCGPGPHFIDGCASGDDYLPSGALVGIDTTMDCVADTNLIMFGPVQVHRSSPLDDSVQFPGTRPMDGHLDVIDTEIISMHLTGGGIILTAGAGQGQGGVLAASLGDIAEKIGDPAKGESFFDVFFEVDLGGGNYAYNHVPLRVQTPVTCIPPFHEYIHVQDCIELYSAPTGGTHIANLVAPIHDAYPFGACCFPDGSCQTTTTPEDCQLAEGVFLGYGTTCHPNPCTCQHRVDLWDCYGDGWNGNTLDVLVNGVTVLSQITLPGGTGPLSYTFMAANGDTIQTIYYPIGGWPYEPYYYIYDGPGNLLGSDGISGTDCFVQPTGITVYGNCNPLHGDTCSDSIVIPALPYDDSRNSCSFNNDYDEVCPYVGSTSPDVVYEYTPASDEQITVDLCNSAYDTKVYIYADACVSPPIACNDDACSDPAGNPYRSKLECVPLPAGHTYYIVVDGYGGDCGVYDLSITVCVPSGACCYPDGSCELTPQEQCSGIWLGAGSTCSPNMCEPCGLCGPWPHFIDTCAAGDDYLPSAALVGIDTDLDCTADTSLIMHGPVKIHRSDPLDDSANFPGTRPLDGHLDVIDTEIVSMNLTDVSGVVLVAGAGLGQGGVLAASLGDIAERFNDPTRGISFFDVFFEVTLPDGTYAYNQTALKVQTPVKCIPPYQQYIHVLDCIELYDSPTGGIHIANLVKPNHDAFPFGACCFEDGSCQTTTTETACLEAGGQFRGPGTTCDPNPCPQPTGACCFPDGSCIITTEAECSGIWLGAGSECSHCEPCGVCGPGPHFIDTCAAGDDFLPSSALVGIDLDLDCVPDSNLVMFGPVKVHRGDPYPADPNVPHADKIDTEILVMNLASGGVTLVAGNGQGQGAALLPSLGSIVEQPMDPAKGDSFFDVFFEVDLGGGTYVYNQTALRVQTVITCIPPYQEYIHVQNCIALWTSPTPGTGIHVANLVAPNHDAYPYGACCFADGSCQTTIDELTCTEAGGDLFLGPGTTCHPNPCPQPPGACCYPDGSCMIVPEEQCTSGIWLGAGTTCSDCDPCSMCGPGPHFIDTCAGGDDALPSGALVGIDMDLDCMPETSLIMHGPVKVHRGNPYAGPPPNDPTHLNTIDTEIVSMNLSSGGVILIAGAGLGQGAVLAASLGQMTELATNPALADSFFDVFFEVDLGGGNYVYNQTALRVQTLITCIPPFQTYIHVQNCVELWTSPTPGQGIHVANLVAPDHDAYPFGGACCFPDGSCQTAQEWVCQMSGGEYKGPDTSCNPNPCFPTNGACCFQGSLCQVMPQLLCTTEGGTFKGFGTTCDPNPCVCYGDLDCNGVVDFADINPFVLYLSNFSGWQTKYPGCPALNGDINGDGTYPDFGDINPFVALMVQSPFACQY